MEKFSYGDEKISKIFRLFLKRNRIKLTFSYPPFFSILLMFNTQNKIIESMFVISKIVFHNYEVIGELGMSGLNVTGRGSDRVLALREAQQNVCLLSEFHNTTSFVRTAPFAVVDGIQYNGVYHYYGRADTYFHIGQELGYGMIRILEKMKENENKMIEHNNMTQVT